MADQVGRVVGGRYRLVAPLGTGASADVYVADDVTLRRRVAVKVLRDALAADEGFLRRFRAEARAVASLRHPNIVTVYDWGEEETGAYLVLEYLGGGSLRDMLDRGVLLTPAQAAQVGLEAARGLDYAHRRGLVHRDIKPANLLFDDEGRLAIADFGIARALAEATWTEPAGAVVGTVRYASPEQARGLSLDGRADVYALALALVESTTGALPFAADTTIATLVARLDRPIDVPGELGPLTAVIAAAGALDPADRPDASGLAGALDRAARELPPPDRLPLAPSRRVPVPQDEFDATTSFAPAGPPAGHSTFAMPPAAQAAAGAGSPDGAAAAARTPGVPPPLSPPGGPPAPAPAWSLGAGAPGPGPGSGPAWPAAPESGPAWGPSPAPAREGPAQPPTAGPRRRRRWPVLIAVAVVIAAALGAVAGVLLRPAPTYAVPGLHGLDPATATARARPHFSVTVHHVRITGDPVGVVLDQRPAPGTKHRPAAIVVDVSDGNALVAVPDLSQMTTDDAGAALRRLGLVVKQGTPAFSDTVATGHVISWSPTGQAAQGDAITLVVSLGSRYVTMPDLVTNQVSADQAARQLVSLGIPQAAIVQTQDFSDTVPAGDVISTTPAAGQQADRGGTVTLDVSKGPDVVPVPDVRGDSVTRAEATLRQAGLAPAVYGPPGFSVVVDQNPLPGHKVKRGSSVQLVAL